MEGSGVSLVMLTVAVAALTWCVAVPLAEVKLLSPLYVAVSVFAPDVVEVRLHEPAPELSAAIVHVAAPSATATLPPGVPAPRVTLTATASPAFTADGSV